MWNKGSVFMVMITVCGGIVSADESLGQQCASKLTAVMTCVAFATGKEVTPQQKCCDSVKEMKDDNPACLCFLIQQIHNGTNPMLKKMNIQEARLLQLSSACKIANASISDCPSNVFLYSIEVAKVGHVQRPRTFGVLPDYSLQRAVMIWERLTTFATFSRYYEVM
ncbi:hypothetical protein R6Q57_022211 [Mikania cordata]